jgi:CubicO group peptidase (beta-lactamase class C family)
MSVAEKGTISPLLVPWGAAAEMHINTAGLKVAAETLKSQVDKGRMPGFLSSVVMDGQLIHFEANGVADLERKVPLGADTLFRLYSQTKPILIVGFLRLMEQGKVGLEDLVARYIPSFSDMVVGNRRRPASRQITIRDLLSHTSGIGFGPGFHYEPENDYESVYWDLVKDVDNGHVKSLADWCDRLAELPLRFQPGSDWGYGFSSDVLGRVVEVVCGQPLDKYLTAEVIEPLGMQDTFFEVPKEKAHRLAALYKREPWDGKVRGKAVVKFLVTDAAGGTASSPSASVFLQGQASKVIQGGGCVCSVAGGLVSTMPDYTRFAQMLLQRGELGGVRLLQESSVILLERDWLNDYTVERRRQPLWVWGTVGVGFSPLGQIGVSHPDAGKREVGSQLHTVHWGGAGGSGYMLNWPHRLMVLTYSGCIYDTDTQKLMWRAACRALNAGKATPIATPTKTAVAKYRKGVRCDALEEELATPSKVVKKRPASQHAHETPKKALKVTPRKTTR